MLSVEALGEVTRLRMGRSLRGRGFYYTSAYLVDGLLVDTGCAACTGELIAALERQPPVRVVVNTHSHEDHVAGNAAVQRRFGARLLAHPLALPVLADPARLEPMHLYRRVFWGRPEPSRAEPLGPWLRTAQLELQVVHTPGHSPDHVALFEPRRGWLFAGDAYTGGQDVALRPVSHIWQVVASLRRLAALPARTLFTGSGTVYHDPGPVLRRKIAYLEQTGERVLALRRRGYSVRRIRRAVLGREPWLCYLTQGDLSGEHLVRSFLEGAPGRAAAADG